MTRNRPALGMLPVTAQPPDLEARVTALQAQMRDLDERGAITSRTLQPPACAAAAGQEQIALMLGTLIAREHGPHDGQ